MKLVSIKDVSELLKVKESTLYSWVHCGKIPFCKINGLVRFDMDEIRAWVAKTKKHPLGILRVEDESAMFKKVVESMGKRYNPPERETSLNQGLGKEVPNGSL